jgi:AcrR family transcriptional regulator
MSPRVEATKRRILDAAAELLRDEGYAALGVNAVARRADVGKPLIYRYFGGFDGLLRELAADASYWVGEEALLDELKAANPTMEYGAFLGQMVAAYTDAARKRPLTVEALRAELAADAEISGALADARGRAAVKLIADLAKTLPAPEAADTEAVRALLIAAAHQMLLAARTSGSFAGLPLKSEQDWARVGRALAHMAEAGLSAGSEPARSAA